MLNINNTTEGYLKNIEIKGNTIQDSLNVGDLADIRSVGDKVEGQELYKIPLLSTGKNLLSGDFESGALSESNGILASNSNMKTSSYVKVVKGKEYILNVNGYHLHMYDTNKVWKKRIGLSKFTADSDGYVRVSVNVSTENIQLEVGTQATPYEPYKEDKITILSPTQLEKVGTVSDRIICVNGVWGVEKNVGTSIFSGNAIKHVELTNTTSFYLEDTKTKLLDDGKSISNLFKCALTGNIGTIDDEFFAVSTTNNRVYFRINKTKFTDINEYLKTNNLIIKFVTTPQFIPLPNDQQVILRTFANKTNISFLTETEGTIKADVPKSLGATVNVHTKEIDNIYTELDRVKKLEQSTVSTVTTDKDFVSVQETSNGYFEDVELKGRTLNNLNSNIVTNISGGYLAELTKSTSHITLFKTAPTSVTNAVLRLSIKNKLDGLWVENVDTNLFNDVGYFMYKCKNDNYYISGIVTNQEGKNFLQDSQIVVLEGDHTQAPPSYFEGLASVGEGVDEIVVSTADGYGNLFDGSVIDKNYYKFSDDGYVIGLGGDSRAWDSIPSLLTQLNIDSDCFLNFKVEEIVQGTTSKFQIYHKRVLSDFTKGEYKVKVSKGDSICFKSNNTNLKTFISITKADTNIFKQKVEDKKRLLFYNPTSEKWEKPVLREWDSVNKKDGKYYYHVGSTERPYAEGDETKPNCITDMTTTVEKLSTETVYEATNIDLITYSGETNFCIKSGVLSPKTTLKVHSNLANSFIVLQKNFSILRNEFDEYRTTQNRLMLKSRYSADRVTFKVDYNSSSIEEKLINLDLDLFNLLMDNVSAGKENYNYDEMIAMMDFYVAIELIDWDMWDKIWLAMESQHNPPIEEVPEETPEV